MNAPGLASAFPRPKYNAVPLGRLLTLWGTAQGGAPSMCITQGSNDGLWRAALRAGAVTLTAVELTYDAAQERIAQQVREGLVRQLESVTP